MAARSNDQEEEIWGTWEELILACLVERHGPHSWDSIASEIRSRSSFSHHLTPDTCRNRYYHLKTRFGNGGGDGGGEDPAYGDEKTTEIPWLDELRKLRVAELRHEVQRHDDSIGSLQLRVKKLKEEREIGSELDTKEQEESQGRKEIVGKKIISGEDSGMSCKESNSTEAKEISDSKPDNRVKLEVYRVVNRSRSESVNTNPTRTVNESSSDVQSSVCRTQSRGVGGRTSVSVVKKTDEPESQPLIAFLEIIKSSKNGIVFDKRLESQESVAYKSTIRRHVDLETIRNRIGTVGYKRAEFFRDLLLLCNNAIVFYPRNSAESISAARLRSLISKEISAKLYKTPRRSPQSQNEPTQPVRPSTLPPLVACPKRSSITVKPVSKEEAGNKEVTKSRGLRTYKGRGKKPGRVENPYMDPEEELAKIGATKKRGMNFLSRLKEGANGKKVDGKKNGREGGKRKEEEGGVKRNVGRPPKRGAKRVREEKAESPVRRKRGRR